MEILIDFETLGLNPNECAVLRFSYLLFEFNSEKHEFDEILSKVKSYNLSINDQVNNYGLKIDKNTLSFWQKTLPNHLNLKNGLALSNFFENLSNDLIDVKIDRWWSRNNMFDPIILYRLAEQATLAQGLETKIKFKINNVRDVRTFMDAIASENTSFVENPFEFDLTSYIKYDSAHEITLDYLNMMKAYNLLNGNS